MALWNVKETARQTGTSEAFWRKMISKREISVIKVGRLVRLDPEVVHAYLSAHTRPARPDGEEVR